MDSSKSSISIKDHTSGSKFPITIQNYIDGKWVPSSNNQTFQRENPANPAEIAFIGPSSTLQDTNSAVEAANAAFSAWSRTPATQRGDLLFRFAALLDAERDVIAEIITKEQGKTLKESLGEINKTISEVRYTAGEASRIEGLTLPSERAGIEIKTKRVPKGVIAAISPWNFPIVTPLRKIAPALAAGNTVVFKPASITAATATKIVELFEKAGLPKGVLNLVIGSGREVGTPLTGHPLVKGVTFTGSTGVGSTIYRVAAERLIETQLEMGGKNAGIVYDCKDIKGAVDQIVPAAFAATGQRCTSISRIVVERSVMDRVVDYLKEKCESYIIGDGMDAETTLGPLVSSDHLETIESFVKIGVQEGATLTCGGKRVQSATNGYFYEPTIFTDVTPDMQIAKEEIFGPVLVVIPVDSFDEAIEITNNTEYGLAASCFTHNMEYADRFVNEVEAGMLHVNNGTISESHVPFGGLKSSAVGAYSIGVTAKDFFTDLKVVYSSSK
ncbi:aldehyde dehydrogenase family protein [Aneurinibacillus sp. Ricciae_BoGa-3]|uniref:aldehyde dehydrogenase family protein n=1 Tax=Aneurinibacillus sp. Ricciae_BoGa-3 TaxID=3022697 RepID=UPI0023416524|nr:aldehyde dehydrogenase family protein [Aneurinibacillus sp. Ricciae_BoGa-3]WCK56412.1 aldehyde dehydrogenase family protein [Aneurinibacillus sp. Ricciae_BoGa-3]